MLFYSSKRGETIMRIIITGTPGTGKTTLAKKLAALLGAPLLDLNAIAIKNKFYQKEKGTAEKIVDLAKLSSKLKTLVKPHNSFVVEGHLACEFFIPCDFIIVLRCNPNTLEKRLKKRKYSAKKIGENSMAETLDYCLIKTEENYAKTKTKIIQIDATKFASPEKLLRLAAGGKSGFVDWMPILEEKMRARAKAAPKQGV